MSPAGNRLSHEKIRIAISQGIPMTWTFQSLAPETIEPLLFDIATILEVLQRPDLKSPLLYCLQELFHNGQKALGKRAYFALSGLDVNKPKDYSAGMRNFKANWQSNFGKSQRFMVEKKHFLQVLFQLREGNLSIMVVNSCPLTPLENERIRNQLVRTGCWEYAESGDPIELVGQEEGGGLGIFIICRILEQTGCTRSAFDVKGDSARTITSLMIPLLRHEITPHLHEKLAGEVESLPQFPEIVHELQRMLKNENLEFRNLGQIIRKDPGLVATILKIVNSASFMQAKKIKEINEALTCLGIKGLKNLLYAYGAELVLSDRYSQFVPVSRHCFEVANAAMNLASNIDPSLRELAFVAGLLHDMGKMIILDQPDALRVKVRDSGRGSILPDWLLESLSFGIDHAELGALVASRWNFPEALVCAIRHHHSLDKCPSEHFLLACIVYFANVASRIHSGEFPTFLIAPEVSKVLGLVSELETTILARSVLNLDVAD